MKMSKTGNISTLEQVEKCTMEGKEKNATVNKNGQRMNPFCFF